MMPTRAAALAILALLALSTAQALAEPVKVDAAAATDSEAPLHLERGRKMLQSRCKFSFTCNPEQWCKSATCCVKPAECKCTWLWNAKTKRCTIA